jgi:hypothetical protein
MDPPCTANDIAVTGGTIINESCTCAEDGEFEAIAEFRFTNNGAAEGTGPRSVRPTSPRAGSPPTPRPWTPWGHRPSSPPSATVWPPTSPSTRGRRTRAAGPRE